MELDSWEAFWGMVGGWRGVTFYMDGKLVNHRLIANMIWEERCGKNTIKNEPPVPEEIILPDGTKLKINIQLGQKRNPELN